MTSTSNCLNCGSCVELLMKKLCNIPVSWRKQIAEVICEQAGGGIQLPQETLTLLSEWDVLNAPTVCISYRDEDNVTVRRCFDFSYLLNQRLNELDPKCLATQEEWYSMSDVQKLQRIIDRSCNCCNQVEIPVTTTTSTSTTTTAAPSGTTTTTLPPITTTTTTTTAFVGNVWFGAKASNSIGSADILARPEFLVNPVGAINFDFTPFNTEPQYLWFAVPQSNPKTKYEAINTPLNQGGVGGADDLFGPPQQVTVNGIALYLYKTAYQTQFSEIIKVS